MRPLWPVVRVVKEGDRIVLADGRRMHIQTVAHHPDGLTAIRWQQERA